MILQSTDSFMPGQYSYPFSFQLPTGIPGTYVYENRGTIDITKASITYSLNCELFDGSGMVCNSSCPIAVMEKAKRQDNYDVLEEVDETLTTGCCYEQGQGNVKIKAIFEKDQVKMNEALSVRISCDLTH